MVGVAGDNKEYPRHIAPFSKLSSLDSSVPSCDKLSHNLTPAEIDTGKGKNRIVTLHEFLVRFYKNIGHPLDAHESRCIEYDNVGTSYYDSTQATGSQARHIAAVSTKKPLRNACWRQKKAF